VVLSDGTHPHPKRKYDLMPGQRVTLHLPGGGGFFPPTERDPERVLQDVVAGLVSERQARETYGVAVDLRSRSVDLEETERLRSLPRAPVSG
jgi:N-methylhydantoinase B